MTKTEHAKLVKHARCWAGRARLMGRLFSEQFPTHVNDVRRVVAENRTIAGIFAVLAEHGKTSRPAMLAWARRSALEMRQARREGRPYRKAQRLVRYYARRAVAARIRIESIDNTLTRNF